MAVQVRGDLIQGLRSILKKTSLEGVRLDGVLIETTGLADPAPVAQTSFADEVIQARMVLAPWRAQARGGRLRTASSRWSMRSTACNTCTRRAFQWPSS